MSEIIKKTTTTITTIPDAPTEDGTTKEAVAPGVVVETTTKTAGGVLMETTPKNR